jgi:hypothetical protein
MRTREQILNDHTTPVFHRAKEIEQLNDYEAANPAPPPKLTPEQRQHFEKLVNEMSEEPTMPPSDPAAEFRVAAHEAAHYLICAEYGIAASPVIYPEAFRRPAPASNGGEVIAGECQIVGKVTPFQAGVIGWAGLIGEALAEADTVIHFPLPLKKSTLRDCHNIAVCNLDKLSLQDQICISTFKSTWTPFRRAYEILVRQRAKLKRLAAGIKPSSRNPAPEPTNQPPPTLTTTIAERAILLEKFLAGMKPGDPDRERFEKILEHLKAGQEPTRGLLPKE